MLKKLLLLSIFLLFIPLVSAGSNEGLKTEVGLGRASLYAYWPMDGNSSSYVGSYTKNYEVVKWNTSGCVISGCAYFDGANDYINYSGKSQFPNKPFSILYWAKFSSLTNAGYLLGDVNPTGPAAQFFIRGQTTPLQRVYDGGTWDAGGSSYFAWNMGDAMSVAPSQRWNLSSEASKAKTDWVMYTHTMASNGSFRTSVDNKNVRGWSNRTSAYTGLRYNLWIGNRPGLDRDYYGQFDEFMVFSVALTQTQINTIYTDHLLGIRPYDNLTTVTNLYARSKTSSSIYINFTRPTQLFYNHTMIYYNYTGHSGLVFVSKQNASSKNITGLNASTAYSIYVYSVAKNGKNTTVGAFVTNTTSAASTPFVLSPKVISHYSFNSTNNKNYTDSTGRYNLTNTGGVIDATGKKGTGYYANSGGDFANVSKPTLIGGGAHYSICGWMKYSSGGGLQVYGGGPANKRPLELLYYNAGSANTFYAIADTGSAQAFKYKAAVDTVANLQARYNFICMTYNGSQSTAANRVAFYYNGSSQALTAFGTFPTTTTAATTTNTIGGKEQSVPITDGVGYVDEVTVFNVTLTAANITWLYNSGSGRFWSEINANFGGSNGGEAPPAASNFSIRAYNVWNNTQIMIFNATVGATTYTTTNGVIVTPLLSSSSTLYNITVRSANYFNNLTYNRGVTTNLSVNMFQSKVTISVRDSVTGAVVSGASINFSGQTTGATFFPYAGTWSVTVAKSGYVTNTTNVVVAAKQNNTVNITLRDYTFSSINASVNNSLAQTDSFNIAYPVNGYCSYTHEANDSAQFEYVWKNGTNTFSYKEDVLSFDSAYYHTCAINSTGRAYCWGQDDYGKLGNGAGAGVSLVPSVVSSTVVFKEISAEFHHTCAIRANDSRIMCWGRAAENGVGTGLDYQVPTLINNPSAFTHVSAGYSHSCAIRANDSRILCWGLGTDGALGDGSTGDHASPVLINSTAAFKAVAANHFLSCAIRSNDSRVLCWGRNIKGGVGDGTIMNRTSPVLINSTEAYSEVSVGYYFSAAIRARDGAVVVWGYCYDGRCVDGTTSDYNPNPHLASFTGAFREVSVGDTQTCAIRVNDSRVFCGGWNWKGEVGDGTTTQRLSAVAVNNTAAFSSLQVGHTTSCALRANDSKMFCWGRNDDSGQIGDGTSTNRPNPTAVSGPFIVRKNFYTGVPRFVGSLPVQWLFNGRSWNFSCRAVTYDNQVSAWDNVSFSTAAASAGCTYSGSGHFTISNTRCNITSPVTVQSGYMWNITNSTVWVKDTTVTGYKWLHLKSGWLHWT
jgi:alpha-tubulin suppressor-like RCC1 family protein